MSVTLPVVSLVLTATFVALQRSLVNAVVPDEIYENKLNILNLIKQ